MSYKEAATEAYSIDNEDDKATVLVSGSTNSRSVTTQIALDWTVNYYSETIVAIPGASKTVQAEQNANAIRIRLSSEQLETVNSLCP